MTDYMPEIKAYLAAGFALTTCCKPTKDGSTWTVEVKGEQVTGRHCSTAYHRQGDRGCRSAGKVPDQGAWSGTGIKDLDTAERRWGAGSAGLSNVGLVTGPPSGVLVLDVDGPEGAESLRKLEEEFGALPKTMRVRSGRAEGGEHLYFRYSHDLHPKIKCQNGIRKKLDIKAEGGFAVLPPSEHASGAHYSWVDAFDADAIAYAPEWLLTLTRPVDKPVKKKKETISKAKKKTQNPEEVRRYVEAAVSQELEAVNSAGHGMRNAQLNTSAFNIAQLAEWIDEEETRGALLDAAEACGSLIDDGLKQCLDTIESGWRSGLAKPRDLSHVGISGPSHEQWHEELARTPKGEVKSTSANVATILAQDPAWAGIVANNTRIGAAVWMREPPSAPALRFARANYPRAVEDVDLTVVGAWLERTWGITLQNKALSEAVDAVSQLSRFDPVAEWLDGLQWDRIPRLDLLLATFFGSGGGDYESAVGRRWMIGAVARALDPGCKVDTCLVLEGGQGVGKSTALRILAGDDYFLDHTPRLSDRKAVAEAIAGFWIVEFAELDSFSRTEVTEVKSFLSTQVDTFRAAYSIKAKSVKRSCVFAASTNETHYLSDPTGNRRFWPIRCGEIDLAGLRRSREQLWAEAAVAYRAGERWHLEDEEAALAAGEAQERSAGDPWEEIILAYMETRTGGASAHELLREEQCCNVSSPGPYHRRRLANIMPRLGFTLRASGAAGSRLKYFRAKPPSAEPRLEED